MQNLISKKAIKEWPEGERPREKLIQYGAENLSDAELLAILLRVGNAGQSAEDLGRGLLEAFNGLSGIDRSHVEDLAYLKAVVSLHQDTFISSGASVKASLLFLQKYTDEEKEQFDQTYATAKAEIEAKYADKITKKTQRFEDAIAKAKENKDAESRKALQKELKGYLKQKEEKKAAESRQLLKERFDYPIFMYEAEKVGISATGDEDQNELYPNANQPKEIEKTCLEWYREFFADPNGFAEAGGTE